MPASRLLAEIAGMGAYPAGTGLFFAILGAGFAATGRAPKWKAALFPLPAPAAALALGVPAVLGLLYGLWHPDPPLWQRSDIAQSVLWFVVTVPVGEELLFRGGLYGALRRLGGDRPPTASNPLPTAVWASALAFALWHWDAGLLVMARTFFLGLWLGWLRWRTDGIRWPLAGHVLLNAAAILL